MVAMNADVAAQWWEHYSESRMGKEYADIIRADGKGYALGRGQLAAIIRKGSMKGAAAGISMAGMVSDDDKPPRSKGKRSKA